MILARLVLLAGLVLAIGALRVLYLSHRAGRPARGRAALLVAASVACAVIGWALVIP